MDHKLFLLLLAGVTILLISSCSDVTSPAATPSPTPDPWLQAVSDAQEVLDNADLESHFAFYQEVASKIDGYLGQLEAVRPALDFIDTLKKTDIPVLGNAWDLLITALDKAYLGAGEALEQVDAGLRSLLETHERLQQLDQLHKTSAAVEQFQASPSRETLEAMGKEMTEADFVLAGVDQDTASLQSKVDGLLTAVDKVQTGLSLLGGVAAPLRDGVKQIQQFIDDISQPLRELSQTLTTLRRQIAEDRELFWNIRDIIRQTEASPQSFQWPDYQLTVMEAAYVGS